MSVLDEIRSEILENTELDVNEKLCLVALLCSKDVADTARLSALMGTTAVTAQMAVRSLRLKGYLKNEKIGSEEEEISALKKLLEKEAADGAAKSEEQRASRIIKASEASGISAAPVPAGFGAETAEVQSTYKSRIAALYKKDAKISAASPVVHSKAQRSAGLGTAVDFERFDEKNANETARFDEDRVMSLIDEAITRSEAAIILGFARGDVEKVEKMYNRVRGTQIKDKIDALVKLLQAN